MNKMSWHLNLRCFFVCLFFVLSFKCLSIDIYRYITAKSAALGGCYASVEGVSNPAFEAFNSKRYLQLNYCNRYGVKELASYSCVFNYPNKYLNSSCIVRRYGFSDYNETLLGVNFYRLLNSKLALGIRANYLMLHYAQQKHDLSVITADVGLLTHPVNNIYLSVLIINPLRTGLEVNKEKINLPSIFLLGSQYLFSSSFLFVVELEKEIQHEVLFKLGLEYKPWSAYALRIGIYGRPFTPTFGLGWKNSLWKIDLAMHRHPVLGIQYNCGLTYTF